MFTISKITFAMAKRRGIDLTLEAEIAEDNSVLVCFWEHEEESEWIFSYRVNGNKLEWHGNVYAPKDVIEIMPTTIQDEAILRKTLQQLVNTHWFRQKKSSGEK